MADPAGVTPENEDDLMNEETLMDLSDDEFAKLAPPTVEPAVEVKAEDEPKPGDISEDTDDEESTPEPGAQPTDSDVPAGSDATPADTGKDVAGADDKASETADVTIDYKAEYEKLMAPFKANGMDMQAKNIDDAIQLMQMGAGFHKKMTTLKPVMRQMKLLEKHGLLEDEKLNFLIDLSNKNPEAVKQLLKDSQLDPLDIDLQADSNYTPTPRNVTDSELVLDEVLNEIRSTSTYQRTIQTVSRDWDEQSQNAVATEPQIIARINEHMQDGTFDTVMKQVDYERSVGRLKGVSDLDAYRQVGNAMADAGVLQRVGVAKPPVDVQPAVEPSKKDIERKQKKRAASPTKTSRTTAPAIFNPLEMSDEEFAKIDINKYIKS